MKKMKGILLSLLLVMLFMAPVKSYASNTEELDLNKADIILQTSDPEIGIAFFISDGTETYKYSSKTKTGTGYFYKTADNSKIANFDCTGTFSYDGSICNVTDVTTSVWGTISGYRVDKSGSKNQISPTYACATGVFNLYKVSIFGDKLTSSATINVYCNQKGVTDVEFNSD